MPLFPPLCRFWLRGGWQHSTWNDVLSSAVLSAPPHTTGCMFIHLICQEMRRKAVTLSPTKWWHQGTMWPYTGCIYRKLMSTTLLFQVVFMSKKPKIQPSIPEFQDSNSHTSRKLKASPNESLVCSSPFLLSFTSLLFHPSLSVQLGNGAM